MNICQECGSEIAAVEAFCPYCGIKIERAVEPEPVADESFESTIVITPAQAASMKEEAESDAAVIDDPETEAKPITSSHSSAPTMEEIPTPMILDSGNARPTDPDVSFEGMPALVAETPLARRIETDERKKIDTTETEAVVEETETEPETELVVEEEESEPAETPHNFESTLPPVETVSAEVELADASSETEVEEEVVEIKKDVIPELDLAPEFIPEPEPVVEAVEIPASELITSETPPVDVPEPIVADNPEVHDIADPAAEFTPPEPEIEAEPEPVVETPDEPSTLISKPLGDLEEIVQKPSMFDSVRIVEGEPPALSQSLDNVTVVPGRETPTPDAPVKDTGDPQPESAAAVGATGAGLGLVDTDGRRSAKLKPLLEGTVLNNRYEIVRKIGGGGMGAVYLASDNNLGGVLRAVKEMVQAHIEEEQQDKAINDFKRESMILSTLDHPSIPTIYDYFYDADEGRFYLVMKYISGGDLASKLRSAPDGKIDELLATDWAIQITDVLNYLHNQPTTIVYRDLKPSNVMLDGNSSRVMLIDFGIARSITQKEEKGVTAVGTMGYAPPELFSGNVEPRSDIYSLGSTMFHLLTGADPQSNPLLIFDFQKNPRPRQINSRLSDQMERILMRTVEYSAESRYSTAAELKAVLEDHLANVRSGNLTYGVTEAPVSVSLANQSVFCGFCGQRIVATDMFCAFCGAKQPLAQQGVHSEIYHKAQMTARLVIEGTSELSAPIYALQKDDNLIGRRDPMSNIFPEVDLSKYDPQTKISRRHAKIWRDGTAYMIEDLGSSNGTVVEGSTANLFKLPAHQPYKLTNGDRIKIGDTRLHFVVG